ncbi:MAG TPA: hypothetical protein VKB79_11210 [Bryobacteraceae bacterium]|nr:hypothetical protein [Bryobacteraceae bacterium]
MRPVRRGVLAWASVLGAISIPAAAQFGISIVSDPGVYSRMATDLAQAIREYQAIITLYQLSQQAYANMVRAATNITTKNVWMPPSTAWTYPSATNTYGTTAGWTQTINSGLGAVPAWSSSAISLQNYNPIWPSLSAGQQTQFGRRYGSIELTDSAATNSMNQVGVVRGNASTTDAAIARLEADSMSNNPALNTEVGVLNQVSAAGVINARQQQSTNQLLSAIADQQTVQAKLAHDSMADAVTITVAAQQAAQQNTAAIWNSTTQAHQARLP